MNPGPLSPLFQIVDRDVVPARWRQHKTWRTQRQTDSQWDDGLSHYLKRVKNAQTSAYRRQELVKLLAWTFASVEDLDNRDTDRAAVPHPVLDFDPEGSLR